MSLAYEFLKSVSLWGIYSFIVGAVLIAFTLGVLLGKRHIPPTEAEDKTPVGSIVAATLGLLAFLLAFTFGIAAEKFDERRKLVVEEANAIGTTYLRAGYLATPHKETLRSLLKAYVKLRLEAIQFNTVEEAIKRSGELQKQLWQEAEAVAKSNPESVVGGLFIQSLNEVIDLHAKRINLGVYVRIPPIIWMSLFFITLLALGSVGYQIGLIKARYNGMILLLILAFSSVIVLIVDLDRPQEGFIVVSQQSLQDLYNEFE